MAATKTGRSHCGHPRADRPELSKSMEMPVKVQEVQRVYVEGEGIVWEKLGSEEVRNRAMPGISVVKKWLKGKRWKGLVQELSPDLDNRPKTVQTPAAYDWFHLKGNGHLYDDTVDAYFHLLANSQQETKCHVLKSIYWQTEMLVPDHLDDVDVTFLWPVCDNAHWWMYEVHPSRQEVTVWDSLYEKGHHSVYLERFETARQRLDKAWPGKNWHVSYVQKKDQNDGNSCGVWTCIYADALIRRSLPYATMQDIPQWRERLLWELVMGRRADMSELLPVHGEEGRPIEKILLVVPAEEEARPQKRGAAPRRSRSASNERSPSKAVPRRRKGKKSNKGARSTEAKPAKTAKVERAEAEPKSGLATKEQKVAPQPHSNPNILRTEAGGRIVFVPHTNQPPMLSIIFGAQSESSVGLHHVLEHMMVHRSNHPDGKQSHELLEHVLARCETRLMASTYYEGFTVLTRKACSKFSSTGLANYCGRPPSPRLILGVTSTKEWAGVLYNELEEMRLTGETGRPHTAAAKLLFDPDFKFAEGSVGESRDLVQASLKRSLVDEIKQLHQFHYIPENMAFLFAGQYDQPAVKTKLDAILTLHKKAMPQEAILPKFTAQFDPDNGLVKHTEIEVPEMEFPVVNLNPGETEINSGDLV
ncbi:unnamed protein product, partial [Mesorhabditis spiculigera]